MRSPSRRLLLPVVLLPCAALLVACGDDSASGSGAEKVTCDYPDTGAPAKEVEKPAEEITKPGQVEVTIKTSVGDLSATLDGDKAPCTVNSFQSLAEQGYYDDTACHRLTTPMAGISVLQCGDPTGTGRGGPGYSFADELSGDETYPAGTLAMANSGPDTNGSQFFIVYGQSQLSPAFTVFGHIDAASLDLVKKVGSKGTVTGLPDGKPKQPVTLESIG